MMIRDSLVHYLPRYLQLHLHICGWNWCIWTSVFYSLSPLPMRQCCIV